MFVVGGVHRNTALPGVVVPDPVHVSVNDLFAVMFETVSDPFVAFVPVHPPDAVQDVALDVVQARVVACPEFIVAGVAVNVLIVGAV